MQQIQFIGTTPTALIDLIDEMVKKRIDDLKKNFEPKIPNEYLTRVEVSKMLSVDISTIHNWTKKGILQSYQIGGRVFYKRKQVENAIVKLKK